MGCCHDGTPPPATALQNDLEQESEFAVNRLAKEKEGLQEEKRRLLERLERATPDASVQDLQHEVSRLRVMVSDQIGPHTPEDGDMAVLRQENAALQRKLHAALSRISELERTQASLDLAHEMDEERQFNLARSLGSDAMRPLTPSSGMMVPGGHHISPVRAHHPPSNSSSLASSPATSWVGGAIARLRARRPPLLPPPCTPSPLPPLQVDVPGDALPMR